MSFHQGNFSEEFKVEGREKFHRSPPAWSSCVVSFCLYKDLQFLIADATPALKQERPADSYNNRSFCHCHVLSISQPLPYARRELRQEKYFCNRAWSYYSLVFPCCLLMLVQLGLWELERMEEQSGWFLLIKTPQ